MYQKYTQGQTIQGCDNHTHGSCYGELWDCERCKRAICYAEGSSEKPELCDECFSKELNAIEKYGEPEKYIENLQELMDLEDLRVEDVKRTLRDINFIHAQCGREPLSPAQLLNKIS